MGKNKTKMLQGIISAFMILIAVQLLATALNPGHILQKLLITPFILIIESAVLLWGAFMMLNTGGN